MKKLILLTVCLMWSCMAISQDLKPIVQHIDNKKYFCFTVDQSRFVAKRLELGLFQDGIIDTLKLDNFSWKQLVRKQDTIIFKLEAKIQNLSLVRDNDREHIDELNLTIIKQNRKIKRGKLERWIFGGGLLILTGIIIGQ